MRGGPSSSGKRGDVGAHVAEPVGDELDLRRQLARLGDQLAERLAGRVVVEQVLQRIEEQLAVAVQRGDRLQAVEQRGRGARPRALTDCLKPAGSGQAA